MISDFENTFAQSDSADRRSDKLHIFNPICTARIFGQLGPRGKTPSLLAIMRISRVNVRDELRDDVSDAAIFTELEY